MIYSEIKHALPKWLLVGDRKKAKEWVTSQLTSILDRFPLF
jgi:hypothetical protein